MLELLIDHYTFQKHKKNDNLNIFKVKKKSVTEFFISQFTLFFFLSTIILFLFPYLAQF